MTREARRRAAVWTRRIRVILGISILIISITLLIWGFAPTRHEMWTQPISPTELQLPTAESLLPLDQRYPVS